MLIDSIEEAVTSIVKSSARTTLSEVYEVSLSDMIRNVPEDSKEGAKDQIRDWFNTHCRIEDINSGNIGVDGCVFGYINTWLEMGPNAQYREEVQGYFPMPKEVLSLSTLVPNTADYVMLID